jgi:hypothetical protein
MKWSCGFMWRRKREKKVEKEEDLLKKLCGNDTELYDLLSKSLYLNPNTAIPKTDVKILVEEAEENIGVEDYRGAMAKYRRALDKAIFEASQNPGETSRYVQVIRDLALKNAKAIAKAEEKGEKNGFASPSLEGRIRYYESMSGRSEDVIRIASLYYNEILEESDASAQALALEERRERRRDAEIEEETKETEAKERREARIKRMGKEERKEAEREEKETEKKEEERRAERRKEEMKTEREEDKIEEERRKARSKERKKQE